MLPETVVSHIQELYQSAFIELFQGLNCSVERLADLDTEPEDAPVTTIDCGSDQLEITILVRIPMSILALTYPVTDIVHVEESHLEDWASEIANQLIGRLKAKLMRHDCHVDLGLPSAYFGIEVASLIPEQGQLAEFYFSVDNEGCECLVSVETFADDIAFDSERDDSLDILEEGEVELF